MSFRLSAAVCQAALASWASAQSLCGLSRTDEWRVRDFCDTYRPAENKVHIWSGEHYGWCECPIRTRPVLPGAAADSPEAFTAQRFAYLGFQLAAAAGKIDRQFLIRGIQRAGDVNKGQALSDTLIWVNDLAPCYPERAVLGILEAYANAGISQQGGLHVQVDVLDASDHRFMSVYSRRVQDQTRSEDWLLIEIPRPLLWHPGMSYELLAFMLLHEIGHGLEASATVRSFCSEALADHWAAHVALPALYGAEAAAGMRIRIARQFESYLRSVYTEASHARSTCSREAVKGYPAMDCRIQGILDPLFMDRNAMTENDYPDSCWSSPECEPVVNDSAVWPSGACTNGLNCIAYESHLLCNDPRLELTVESAAASFIEDLFSLCATRPDICSQKQRQSGKGNTTVMDARRLERMLRRARKRLDPIKGRSDEAVKRR